MSLHRLFAPLALVGLICLTGCTYGNRPLTESQQCGGEISIITLTECPGGPYTVYICASSFTVDDCYKNQPARICIWDGWVIVTAPDGSTVTTPDVAVTLMEERPPTTSQPSASSGASVGGLAMADGTNLQFLALAGEMNWQPASPKVAGPILVAKLNDKSDFMYAPHARGKMAGRHWFGGKVEAQGIAVVSTEGLTYEFCDLNTANPPNLTPSNPQDLNEVKKWALTIDEYIGRVRQDVAAARNCTPHPKK